MSGIRVIVGLGNPGREYERTRHNAGAWLLERFALNERVALRSETKYQAYVGRHETTGAWLLVPQTYMNLSGRSVQLLAGFFKIPPGEILVLHDELDFPTGTAKMKLGGGVAGHNGLKDIAGRLGSTDFWRLRVGIGHPGHRDAVAGYVLQKPPADERAAIDAAIERAAEVLPLCLAGDMQAAMLKLHSGDKPPRRQPAPPKEADA